MMPIKAVREVCYNGRKGIANICVDKQGRECVSTPFGYQLLLKDGYTVGKRQADWD